jgi:predicted enzyme related to lactoylglutathione lyase
VDCADPYALAGFWHEVTGWKRSDADFAGDPEAILFSPGEGAPDLLFVAVDDPKLVKNRWHVDVQPTDRTRDEEVERLLGLGATQVDDQRRPDGTGWVVLADPEGNEFCVERSEAERDPA